MYFTVRLWVDIEVKQLVNKIYHRAVFSRVK